MSKKVVIVSAVRTPIGSFLGSLSTLSATKLGSIAIKGAMDKIKLDTTLVQEVFMGNVVQAGVGQAPARQAALGAGLPDAVPCTTVNKVCGSGMKAAMFAHDLLVAGSADVVVAGGMESMTNAPYLVPRGLRMGHAEALDHMFYDGLQNPYDGQMMGMFGDQCADKYGFTREMQDAFAVESVNRANRALADGAFADEIVPVEVKGR